MPPASCDHLQRFDSAWGTRAMPQRALHLWEAIQYPSLLPDGITSSALISACGKSATPKGALQLLEAMLH